MDPLRQPVWSLFQLGSILAATLARRNINIAGLQESWVMQRLQLTGEELLHDIRFLSRENTAISGADVYLQVTQRIWWALPFYALFSLPGFNRLLHLGYRNRSTELLARVLRCPYFLKPENDTELNISAEYLDVVLLVVKTFHPSRPAPEPLSVEHAVTLVREKVLHVV